MWRGYCALTDVDTINSLFAIALTTPRHQQSQLCWVFASPSPSFSFSCPSRSQEQISSLNVLNPASNPQPKLQDAVCKHLVPLNLCFILSQADTATFPSSDTACICSGPAFAQAAGVCVQRSCGASDAQAAAVYIHNLCRNKTTRLGEHNTFLERRTCS
jgi:CFEM domain